MLLKLLGVGALGLLCLTLMGMMPASSQEPQEPPPPKKKELFSKKKGEAGKKGEAARKKGEEGPEGDLNRAYHLLRRLRADGQSAGNSEARIREWTDRAVDYYRNGLRALRDDNPQLAHEYGAIAHDLARAIEHARNAALYDRPDDDLPAPPQTRREGRDGEARKDLAKAYERLREGDDGSDAGPKAKYYRDAASELYRAARRDFDAGRIERLRRARPRRRGHDPRCRAPRPRRRRPRGASALGRDQGTQARRQGGPRGPDPAAATGAGAVSSPFSVFGQPSSLVQQGMDT